MTILEDIQQMQIEGRSEQEIISALQERGFAPREIAENIAQAKIKEAVLETGNENELIPKQPISYSQEENFNQQAPASAPYSQEAYPGYQQQYESYAPTLSTDTIAEIAEQVVLEKLSPLKERIEQIIDLKTSMQATTENLDERLKHLEKIIDRLQLSILQKVGEYVTNVSDIKSELQETQKSFKALLSEHHHKR